MKKTTILLLTLALLATALPVQAQDEDLEVGPQNLLPGSPFYFLKQLRRRVQVLFTSNPVKKLELKQKFSSEKLAELEQLAEQGKSEEALQKALRNYELEEDQIRDRVQELNQKASESEEVKSFMEKYIHQKQVHNRVLEKLEDQVPSEVQDKIREQREKHLERFKDVMLKLENENYLPQRMEHLIQTSYRNFGSERPVEVLEQVREKVQSQSVKHRLNQVRERVKEKVSEEEGGEACAQVITYCINPETGNCTQYSSACTTPKPCQPCQGQNPDSVTKPEDTECEERWWFDNSSRTCQKKEFCGMYMYQGLRTFEEESACQAALENDQFQREQGPMR